MSTSVTGGVGAVRTTAPTNFSKILKPQDCGDVGVNSGEADMQKEPRLELNDTLICELKRCSTKVPKCWLFFSRVKRQICCLTTTLELRKLLNCMTIDFHQISPLRSLDC